MLGENETPWHISPQNEGSCQQGQQTPRQTPLSPGALVFQQEEKLELLLEDPTEAAGPPSRDSQNFVASPVSALCFLHTEVCCKARPILLWRWLMGVPVHLLQQEDFVCLIRRLMDFFVPNHTFLGPFLAISVLGCRVSHNRVFTYQENAGSPTH